MLQANELLYGILKTLGKIEINTRGGKGASGAGAKAKAGNLSLDLNNLIQDQKKNENLKNTSAAIKELSSALGPLSSGLIKFGLIPKSFKKSIIFFIHDLLAQSDFRGMKASIAAKQVAEAMNILGEALPKLAKGVFRFGLMSKTGLVRATAMGIETLMGALAIAGNPLTLPFVLAGAAALSAVGVALMGIASVLKSIALLVLAFASSIIIMVGAIYLATKLFHVKPLAAMGIIVGSIAILAGGFALIGILSPLIIGAGAGISAMGVGLLLLGIGMLAFLGAGALMNKLTGSQEATDLAFKGMIKSVVLMSLLFAGLGLIGKLIFKGGIAVQSMGKGMMFLAGGLLLLGGAIALLKLMKVDLGEMIPSLAKGLAILGLVFAGLGLFSILIIPGTAALLAISLSIGLFALVALGIGAIIKKLGGKEGMSVMTDNISMLISSVLQGVIKGVSTGLLGEEGSSKGFFGKIGTVAKNVAILIGSIGLLMGVSFALIMFAFAIKAFTKAGIIKTVTGYKPNGEPIYGESVNVVSAGENIAKSVGSFFTTLTETFKDPSIIPDKGDIENIIDILMGNQGFRVLGIRLAGKKRPGLIDALSKFASLISIFAQVNKIPVYEIDKNGNTKIKEYIDASSVATNVVGSLSAFFKAFKDNESTLSSVSSDTTEKIAEILLGRDAFRLLGLKVGRNKPGILEPINKFAEILTTFGKFGSTQEIPILDENGKVVGKVKVTEVANQIVANLASFATTLANASISGNIDKAEKNINKYSGIIEELSKFSESLTPLEKASDTISNLAKSISDLSVSLDGFDQTKLSKLAAISVSASGGSASGTGTPGTSTAAKLDEKTKAIKESSAKGPDWDLISAQIGSSVGSQLVDAMKKGQVKFEFSPSSPGKGVLTFD